MASTRRFILGIDQGTTGSTALVLSPEGRILSRANAEFPQYFPQPGWVEHHPIEIWGNVQQVVTTALGMAGVTHAEVAAIGVTNQRETTVLWERATGRPIAPAIVWQCRRTTEMCRALREAGHEPLIRQRTGLVLDPYFSGTKVAWLLDHVSGARARAESGEIAFGTIDAWLLFQLTGRHATDASNASRTLLYNIHSRTWDDELLALLRVPRALLPEVLPSRATFGVTRPEAFGGAEVPVLAMAGDQQAALAGHFGFEAGSCKNTYGTGCFALANVGSTNPGTPTGLLTTLTPDREGNPQYALEGSIFVAGAAVQWLRDGLGIIREAGETEALAASIPDTAGVYMVPAFVGLGSPYWNADARGAFLGLTRGSRREHLVRATLESIAYQTRDVIDTMRSAGGVTISALTVDGGATNNGFLMQFQADILGIPVIKRTVNETTAFGAALLAGMEGKIWTAEQVQATVGVEREFHPRLSESERQERYAGWKAAVGRVL